MKIMVTMMKSAHWQNPEYFIPTRRSLLSRLKQWDDQDSWQDFFNTYWKLIYAVALQSGLTEAEAEEVVQDTIIEVSHKMPGFKYDPAIGSFKGWLLKTTRWRIRDQFRKRRSHSIPLDEGVEGSLSSERVDSIPDPAGDYLEAVWNDEWQKNLMDAALDKVKAKVKPKQYQMFDLYVLKEWPVQKVMQTLRVSATQVYVAKFRICSLLKKEIKNLESKSI